MNKNDIATQHFTDSFSALAQTPAQAAWDTAKFGVKLTVIYSVISYVMQRAIVNLFDDQND